MRFAGGYSIFCIEPEKQYAWRVGRPIPAQAFRFRQEIISVSQFWRLWQERILYRVCMTTLKRVADAQEDPVVQMPGTCDGNDESVPSQRARPRPWRKQVRLPFRGR
jgi:hypothetical protein